MSVYHYLKCDKHMVYTGAASSKSSGYAGPLGDPGALESFIVRHAFCPVSISIEFDDNLWEKYKKDVSVKVER